MPENLSLNNYLKIAIKEKGIVYTINNLLSEINYPNNGAIIELFPPPMINCSIYSLNKGLYKQFKTSIYYSHIKQLV